MFATLGIWRPVVATKVSIKLKVSSICLTLSNDLPGRNCQNTCTASHAIPTFPFIHFHSKIPYHISTSQSPLVPHLEGQSSRLFSCTSSRKVLRWSSMSSKYRVTSGSMASNGNKKTDLQKHWPNKSSPLLGISPWYDHPHYFKQTMLTVPPRPVDFFGITHLHQCWTHKSTSPYQFQIQTLVPTYSWAHLVSNDVLQDLDHRTNFPL